MRPVHTIANAKSTRRASNTGSLRTECYCHGAKDECQRKLDWREMTIPPLPKTFDLEPYVGRWLEWARVERCFWPGRGARAVNVDPELAPVKAQGGVYVFASRVTVADAVSHVDSAVIYIGETVNFAGRMADWARSAGFWGDRQKGHSAAWRWSEGSNDLSVAFFTLPEIENRRLAKHVRLYYEIIATEEYRVAHGRLPKVNEWDALESN